MTKKPNVSAANVQVLVAAMNQTDALLKRMNIQSSAIVGNQCEENSVQEFQHEGYPCVFYSFKERGVGLNRNNALLRASGDVVVFADEDMVMADEYPRLVREAFERVPKADAIVFNIRTVGADVGRRCNTKIKRVRFFNSLNYGTARLSVRLAPLKREAIYFNTLFGGGTQYSSGEDTLFIQAMLKKRLKIYTYPATIGEVDQSTSTWFAGYTEKYFFDKGVLFAAISRPLARVLALREILVRRRLYRESMPLAKAYRLMLQGIKAHRTISVYLDSDNS